MIPDQQPVNSGVAAILDSRPELTSQELCVLEALAWHGFVPVIAEALCISTHTVEAHLSSIREKTGLRHAAQLVRWGYDAGLLKPLDRSGGGRMAAKKIDEFIYIRTCMCVI